MIIISDFDDTLFPHHSPEAFAKNLFAVQEFRATSGNEFALATGRSLSSIQRIFPDYKQYMDHIILDNGAICLDVKSETALLEYTIARPLAIEIMALISQLNIPGSAVFYYDFTEHPEPAADVTKIRYWTKTTAETQQIVDAINQNFPNQVRAYAATGVVPPSIPWINDGEFTAFADIAPLDAGKENMIAEFRHRYRPSDHTIVTVGDSYNDIDMLRRFDGYAMANARPEVKAVVPPEHIVSTVSELIAKFL